ncbi:hypothetical protein BGX23_006791 [Mortierella sp. AD031]|nr:hypothetical protein BGX23_006791 [Mortierella sp. AD031]KAG0217509.1 hypothetical protein BGX33_010400 [Mortierella sp. NVP41]
MEDSYDHAMEVDSRHQDNGVEEDARDTHPRRSDAYHDDSRRRDDTSDRDRDRDHRDHRDHHRDHRDYRDRDDRDDRDRDSRDDYHRRRRDSRDYGSNNGGASEAAVAGGTEAAAPLTSSSRQDRSPGRGRTRSRSPLRGHQSSSSVAAAAAHDPYQQPRPYESTAGGNRDNKYDTDRERRRSGSGVASGREAAGYERERRRSRSRSPAGSRAPNHLRDRRVYVGNLSYDVAWTDLKDFMREVGPVAHADVLLGPDGRSKGCGVVEFQNADDAKTAIRKMNDVVLKGRPVFVREDRESGERIGASGGRAQTSRSADVAIRQVFVGNLPFSVHWKDLKDMFRRAGPVDRADVFMSSDMRSKGSGIVLFERTSDVQRAICT